MDKKRKRIAQTRKVVILDEVFRDVEKIVDYIAINNYAPLNAKRVSDYFFEVIRKISLYPLAFKECELLATKAKMYRQAACLSWLIIYKVTDKEITVLRVFHSARSNSKIRRIRRHRK